jgi:hypothetical protein
MNLLRLLRGQISFITSLQEITRKSRVYDQQFDNMQRMNQKWLDLFSKSWEQQQNQNEKR